MAARLTIAFATAPRGAEETGLWRVRSGVPARPGIDPGRRNL